MVHHRTRTLYPAFAARQIKEQGGPRWADIVARVGRVPVSDRRSMAFTLTLRRLHRQGRINLAARRTFCAVCVAEALAGFDGGEAELVTTYHACLDEITETCRAMQARRLPRRAATALAV
jgi:hypothetical protein